MIARRVQWVKSHWPMLLLYVFLLGVAVGAAATWNHPDWVGGSWASQWMPNIGASAVTVLVTIAVVDQIVRRQHSLPLRPRRDRARRSLGNAWLQYVRGLACDYEETHVGKNFRPIPTDTLQVIDHWLNAEAEDRVRDEVRAGGDPYPLTGAEKLAGELNGVLESVSDQAALDEELKNAIVTLRDQVRIARAVYLVMKDLDAADWNCAGAVEAARSFGEVIRRYGDQSHVGRGHFFPPVSATDGLRLGWRDLDPHTVAKITLAHRKRAVLTALEDVYKAYQRAPSELDAARTEFWRILEESPQDGAWTTRDDMIIEAFNHWKTLGGSPKEFPIPKDVLDEWRQARRPSGTEPSRHETPDFPADP